MTMKYAVVPYREVSVNGQYPEVRTGDHWVSLSNGNGKLTREQVEAMAQAYEVAVHGRMSCSEAMAGAANYIGISVEE